MSNVKLDTLSRNLSQGLGSLVWWEFKGANITPDALRTLLSTVQGLSTIHIPDVDKVAALKDTVRGFSWGDRANKLKAEVVHEENGIITIGLLKHERPQLKEAGWKQVDTLEYEEKTGNFSGTRANPEAVSKLWIDIQFAQKHLDHRFIRPKIIHDRLTVLGGMSIRQNGSVWYVPSQYHQDLCNLADVICQIGQSKFSICNVNPDPRSQAAAASDVNEAMVFSAEALIEGIKEWEGSTRKMGTNTVENILMEFADLNMRCDLYETALSCKLEDFREKMKEAQALASRIINEVAM